MLSLLACFGLLPCNETSIQVYSKLGGIFLGAIRRPCVENKDAYSVLRKLQDTIATLLCHPKMPPRYLALFVGTLRLTSPDFPFVDQVDAKSSQQVLGALGEAERLDAMWDESELEAYAYVRLENRGFGVRLGENKLTTFSKKTIHDAFLPPELEAFTFYEPIKTLQVCFAVQHFRSIHTFPHLEELQIKFVHKADFESLARIKTLVVLKMVLPCLDGKVGALLSLQTLDVCQTRGGGIPASIGLLTNLKDLTLSGKFNLNVPSELGNLRGLKCLTIEGTNVSGVIPSELCRLTNLEELTLDNNLLLEGSLPKQFGNLSLLTTCSCDNTHVNTKGFLDSWKHHVYNIYTRTV